MNYFLVVLLCVLSPAVNSQDTYDTLSVYFDYNSHDLSSEEGEKLLILSTENEVVSLYAYCDTVGTIDYNKELAGKRAQSVLGSNTMLRTAELFVIGETKMGEHQLYIPEENRRVDIVYRIPTPAKIIEELEPISKNQGISNVQRINNKFVDFLKDSTVLEDTIQMRILFFPGSVDYLPESEAELRALFEFMNYNPNVSAHIRGHICCERYLTYDDISAGRAYTVEKYLSRRGISHGRMTYKGYGTSLPFRSPEITEEDKRLNRRVDIIFSKLK